MARSKAAAIWGGCDSWNWNKKKILLVLFLELLVLGVRLHYSVAPAYINDVDEGVYMHMIYTAINNGIYQNFGNYRGADFSNVTNYEFNSGNVFWFYTYFIYPEILFNRLVGVSASHAVDLIILFALFEALFVFLIIDRLMGTTAATIGIVLLAFFPLDVVFSNYLEPFVELSALMALAVLLFLRGVDDKGLRASLIYVVIAGGIADLGYQTNPLGALLVVFLALYSLAAIYLHRKDRPEMYRALYIFVALIFGFAVAYSLTGIYYLRTTSNFLLYPSFNHAMFIGEMESNSNYNSVLLSFGNFSVVDNLGSPSMYLTSYFGLATSQIYHVYLFSAMLFVVAASVFALLLERTRHALFFVALLGFLMLALNLTPVGTAQVGGKTQLGLLATHYMYLEILTVPIVVLAVIPLIILFKGGGAYKLLCITLIAVILAFDILALNYDFGYYKASVASYVTFLNFYNQHKNATFYMNYLYGGNAAYIVGENATNIFFIGCGQKTSFRNDSYLLVGGTIGLEDVPSTMESWASCFTDITNNQTPVVYLPNPLAPYKAGGARDPPFEIYRIS